MDSTTKSKHILILGGMGPQASVYAHSLLLKAATRSGATDNEDYPRITHLSINVKDFISTPAHKQEALDYLALCFKEIDTSTVDAAFIACNTAHILQTTLEGITGLTFTSLIDVAVESVTPDEHISKIGLLATPSTLKTELYRKKLGESMTIIEPSSESSQHLETIIRSVIGGGDAPILASQLRQEVELLLERGAQKVLLGCTELSLLGAYLDKNVIIDPLALTVEKVLHDE